MMAKMFWLWVPIVFLFMQLALEFTLPSDVLANMLSESGPHELIQFLIMTFAAFFAIRLLLMSEIRADKFLFGWVGIAFLACVYIAGEEMSWGQHIYKWNSSEYWHRINDQGETNFHNTSSWLDQKPRLLLEIGVIVGGVNLPLIRKFKPSLLPNRFESIYPTHHVIPTSIMLLILIPLDKIDDALDSVVIFERLSEVEELYLYFFVLIYLTCLRKVVTKKTP